MEEIRQKVFYEADAGIRQDVLIFDETHCSLFADFPNMRPLIKKHWDTFKNINLVIADPICAERGLDQGKILILDDDQRKLQSCKENSLLVQEYTEQDVLGLPDPATQEFRDDQWQHNYFQKVGDVVMRLLDECDNVQSYLEHGFEFDSELSEFKVKDMLGQAQDPIAQQASQEL